MSRRVRFRTLGLRFVSGANVNHQDDFGETPMHVALNAEQTDIVELLARNGGDFSIKNCDGETPGDLIRRQS